MNLNIQITINGEGFEINSNEKTVASGTFQNGETIIQKPECTDNHELYLLLVEAALNRAI